MAFVFLGQKELSMKEKGNNSLFEYSFSTLKKIKLSYFPLQYAAVPE